MIPDMTGKTVEIMRYNYCLSLWTADNWQLDLAGETTLQVDGQAPVAVDTELCQDELTDDVRPLLGKVITSVSVSPEGDLDIEFDDARLSVSAGYDYEAWQLSGPNGEKVICMPGGELAIWGPRTA